MSLQGLLFPRDIISTFGVRPGLKHPSARLYKSLVAREGQIPNPVLWISQSVMDIYDFCDTTDLTCRRCGFVNIIASEHPAPKTRLDSERCMECGAPLDCPICWSPLEVGYPTEQDRDLLCTNLDCDFWTAIW